MKPKTVAKKENTELFKPQKCVEEFKKSFNKRLSHPNDPLVIFKKLQKLDDEWKKCPKKSKKYNELQVRLNKEAEKINQLLSLETGCHLMLSVSKDEIPFALEMNNQLKKEFDVKTPTEKSLIQTTVATYCRWQKLLRAWNDRFPPAYISHEISHSMSVIGKEIDRSQRQYISLIQTLQQIKQPPMKVNIKANTAFVAQNQQNIANSKTDEPQ